MTHEKQQSGPAYAAEPGQPYRREIMARAKGQRYYSRLLKLLVWLAAALTAGVILLMVGYILLTGIPN